MRNNCGSSEWKNKWKKSTTWSSFLYQLNWRWLQSPADQCFCLHNSFIVTKLPFFSPNTNITDSRTCPLLPTLSSGWWWLHDSCPCQCCRRRVSAPSRRRIQPERTGYRSVQTAERRGTVTGRHLHTNISMINMESGYLVHDRVCSDDVVGEGPETRQRCRRVRFNLLYSRNSWHSDLTQIRAKHKTLMYTFILLGKADVFRTVDFKF